MPRIRAKWRPSLWLVLGGALAGTLGLSFAGLVVLRYLGPEIGFRLAAGLVGGAILVATLILWVLLLRLLLRPISALALRATDLRRNPRARPDPLPHYGTRELRDLGESVLEMAARLQDREATIRTFTDHVTHDLKTPVAAVQAAAEMLSEAALAPQDRLLVDQITGAATQMQRQLVALQKAAAAREPMYHGRSRLADLMPGLVADQPELSILLEGADQPLGLNAEGWRIVLGHLLANAATAGAKEVRLTATPGRLVVSDDGSGVSEGNRAHVFEPFFTTGRESGGTGTAFEMLCPAQ
jgi:two-component system, OmpR family, sensor kinase